jgi:hypothetical protein
MYHPKPGREQEHRAHRQEQSQFIRTALPVLTVVFWVTAAICVVMIAVYAFTQSMGTWLSWMTVYHCWSSWCAPALSLG